METGPPVLFFPWRRGQSRFNFSESLRVRALIRSEDAVSFLVQKSIVEVSNSSFATDRLLETKTMETVETVDLKPFPATLFLT